MASLAAFLAFPLGGGGGFFPSQSFQGTAPLGATGDTGTGPYFNPNYPINAGPYTYPTFAPENLIFLRWMPTPLVNGSTVIDLVMPAGYNFSEEWYIVLYTYSGGTIF